MLLACSQECYNWRASNEKTNQVFSYVGPAHDILIYELMGGLNTEPIESYLAEFELTEYDYEYLGDTVAPWY